MSNTAAPTPRRTRNQAAAFFVALVASTVAFAAALAHVLEMPNKLALDRDAYFTVQGIYAGWNLLGIVLLVQLLALVTAAVLSRRDRPVLVAVVLAIIGLVGAQTVFWIWTFPANAATANWTEIPDVWEPLRDQWEYSHAAGALFQAFGLVWLFVAVLLRGRTPV